MASYLESYNNCVEIITRAQPGRSRSCAPKPHAETHAQGAAAVNDETGTFQTDPSLTFAHPYPATKVMFLPDREGSRPDLVATTGDYLRIWHVSESGVELQKLLNTARAASFFKRSSPGQLDSWWLLQNKNTDFCAPLTSFDWNETDPRRLGTSSIDTTCTIWDIEVRQQRPQH